MENFKESSLNFEMDLNRGSETYFTFIIFISMVEELISVIDIPEPVLIVPEHCSK